MNSKWILVIFIKLISLITASIETTTITYIPKPIIQTITITTFFNSMISLPSVQSSYAETSSGSTFNYRNVSSFSISNSLMFHDGNSIFDSTTFLQSSESLDSTLIDSKTFDPSNSIDPTNSIGPTDSIDSTQSIDIIIPITSVTTTLSSISQITLHPFPTKKYELNFDNEGHLNIGRPIQITKSVSSSHIIPSTSYPHNIITSFNTLVTTTTLEGTTTTTTTNIIDDKISISEVNPISSNTRHEKQAQITNTDLNSISTTALITNDPLFSSTSHDDEQISTKPKPADYILSGSLTSTYSSSLESLVSSQPSENTKDSDNQFSSSTIVLTESLVNPSPTTTTNELKNILETSSQSEEIVDIETLLDTISVSSNYPVETLYSSSIVEPKLSQDVSSITSTSTSSLFSSSNSHLKNIGHSIRPSSLSTTKSKSSIPKKSLSHHSLSKKSSHSKQQSSTKKSTAKELTTTKVLTTKSSTTKSSATKASAKAPSLKLPSSTISTSTSTSTISSRNVLNFSRLSPVVISSNRTIPYKNSSSIQYSSFSMILIIVYIIILL